MKTVSEFLKHLLSLSPQDNAARLALYHYLKNFRSSLEYLEPELIESFIRKSLSLEYWRENQDVLTQETLKCLNSFYDSMSGFDFSKIKPANKIQVIALTHQNDLYEIVQKYLLKTHSATTQYRLIPFGHLKCLAVILLEGGGIKTIIFDNLMTLENGQITPLNVDQCLIYTKELELNPSQIQLLEIAPYIWAQFTISNDGLRGTLIKGYTYQKVQALESISLNKVPDIFYTLKRIERYFVNQATDPFYRDLINILEQGLKILQTNLYNRVTLAERALDRGLIAFEKVFPDDKILQILIKDLTHSIQVETERIEKCQSISPPQYV